MVVKDKEIEKMCSFYVSEFHLEMILVPFINNKIEKKEKIIIKNEYSLENTLKILLSRINIKEENKTKILDLGWNIDKDSEIENESNIIIIGSKKYIEKINSEIIRENLKDITIVDCYKIDDIGDNVTSIVNNYNTNLNTSGFENLKKIK